MTDEIRVLIADDHAVVRQGLRLFLDLQPELRVVGEAEDGQGVLEQVATLKPDVVVMDLVMPGIDGVEATKALRERAPEVKVLALSSFSDGDHVLAALRAGAAGYLTKETSPDELANGIRAVWRGEPVLCKEAARRVLDQLGHAQRPEGTVTLLFTDIEGSTRLLESLGERPARELFRQHDRLVRDTLERYGGVEVEREGDSFMLAFSSARRAVLCAVEIQRALVRSELPMRVRIGLNTGEVVAEEDRYFGRAVFVASRVAGSARGGEILLSELTCGLVGEDDFVFRDRGLHDLKGLKGSHRLIEAVWTQSAS